MSRMEDIIWKAYAGDNAWGNDVTLTLPDNSKLRVCGSIVAVRAKAIVDLLDMDDMNADISDCNLDSDAIRSVMDHVHGALEVSPPRRDLPRDLDRVLKILQAADYCDATACKEWAEDILIDTYVLRSTDTNLRRIIEKAFVGSERLFAAAAKEIYRRRHPEHILQGAHPSLLDKYTNVTNTKRPQHGPGEVASGHEDGCIRFWDCATGECLRILTSPIDKNDVSSQPPSAILALHFSPDGSTVVSAHDSICRLWDIESGACIRLLDNGHTKLVTCCIFSPDGALVATGSQDNKAILWPIVTLASTRTLSHSETVNSIAFTHDGASLATASDDFSVRLWTTATGICLHIISSNGEARIGHSAPVNCVTFSPIDSSLLCSCSDDCTAKLWNPETGSLALSIRGSFGPVRHAAFSPNSTTLALAFANRTISLYNPYSGSLRKHLHGHTDAINAVVYSYRDESGDDDGLLISGSDDCTMRIWDPVSAASLRTLEDARTPLVFNLVKALSFRPPLATND